MEGSLPIGSAGPPIWVRRTLTQMGETWAGKRDGGAYGRAQIDLGTGIPEEPRHLKHKS